MANMKEEELDIPLDSDSEESSDSEEVEPCLLERDLESLKLVLSKMNIQPLIVTPPIIKNKELKGTPKPKDKSYYMPCGHITRGSVVCGKLSPKIFCSQHFHLKMHVEEVEKLGFKSKFSNKRDKLKKIQDDREYVGPITPKPKYKKQESEDEDSD